MKPRRKTQLLLCALLLEIIGAALIVEALFTPILNYITR